MRPPKRQERRKRRAQIDPNGYDAGKKIKGKKRHVLADTQGRLLCSVVHPAGIQDRDGGVLLMQLPYGRFPFLEKLFADGGCQGPVFAEGVKKAMARLEVEIVKRSDAAIGFEVLPLRWIVERSIGWHGCCRRLAKDYGCPTKNALAFLKLASIGIMLRRLCMG